MFSGCLRACVSLCRRLSVPQASALMLLSLNWTRLCLKCLKDKENTWQMYSCFPPQPIILIPEKNLWLIKSFFFFINKKWNRKIPTWMLIQLYVNLQLVKASALAWQQPLQVTPLSIWLTCLVRSLLCIKWIPAAGFISRSGRETRSGSMGREHPSEKETFNKCCACSLLWVMQLQLLKSHSSQGVERWPRLRTGPDAH